MTKDMNESSGYVRRERAIQILEISGTSFDRIAKSVFGETRISEKNAFWYSVKELHAYHEYRKKCKRNEESSLTWAKVVILVPALQQQIRVLSWTLSPVFPADDQTQGSAAFIQQHYPADYERAKQTLKDVGLDLEEIRKRLTSFPSEAIPYPYEEPYSIVDPPMLDGEVYF